MRIRWLSRMAVCIVWIACAPAIAQQNPAMQNPGVLQSQTTQSGINAPPLPGANSFVEGQARKLLQSQGFDDISPLVNDSQGIWRGTAMSGSKKVRVSVDYKGNVTANPE